MTEEVLLTKFKKQNLYFLSRYFHLYISQILTMFQANFILLPQNPESFLLLRLTIHHSREQCIIFDYSILPSYLHLINRQNTDLPSEWLLSSPLCLLYSFFLLHAHPQVHSANFTNVQTIPLPVISPCSIHNPRLQQFTF